jgi:predicted ATPase
MARGSTSYFMGEFLPAREHFEIAISIYDPDHHRPLAFRYGGADAGVRCLSYAAWTLWQLGYPDQALKRGTEARALAQALSHPFGLAWAEVFVDVLRQLRGEVRATQETAERLSVLSAEHGLADFSAFATILHGWAMVEQERNEEGIAKIREGLAATRATGAELVSAYFLCLLAEACMDTGHLDDALSALTDAMAAADENEDRFFEAETHRLKGELLLKRHAKEIGVDLTDEATRSAQRSRRPQHKKSNLLVTQRNADSNAAQAQNCFERAIEVARKQSAKSLELRATTSLARLLNNQGRRVEARAMLADIYGWFTEGFDTADLIAAKVLIDQLSI